MAKTPMNKRSPTAHRSLKQMRAHNKGYGAKPSVMKKDAETHKARRALTKKGKVRTGDGNDVSHKKAAVKGGSHKLANMKVQPASKNRGHGMSPGGTKKGTGRRGGKTKA